MEPAYNRASVYDTRTATKEFLKAASNNMIRFLKAAGNFMKKYANMSTSGAFRKLFIWY
jgi:hypothetical protein